MVPYWPDIAKDPWADKLELEFAKVFDSKKMVVVSKSLKKAEDHKTSIVRKNLRDEILKLKRQPGQYILTGGVAVPSQFIELGLVDECHFLIQPIIAGKGRRLMEGTSPPKPLRMKLIGSKVFKSGAVALRYVKP